MILKKKRKLLGQLGKMLRNQVVIVKTGKYARRIKGLSAFLSETYQKVIKQR